jgi:hypothetical protein
MATPQEKILQLAGLDAFMLLRYIRLCLKVRFPLVGRPPFDLPCPLLIPT